MTKKDYEAFAAMINGLISEADQTAYDPRLGLLIEFAWRTADIFKADNARFNRERFLQACGIE